MSNADKSELIWNYPNEDNGSLSGIQIQSACSIDIQEFEQLDSAVCQHSDKELTSNKMNAEIAESTENVKFAVDKMSSENMLMSTNSGLKMEDKSKSDSKPQPGGVIDCVVSCTILKSNDNSIRYDDTSVSNVLLERDPVELSETKSSEQISINLIELQAGCENSHIIEGSGQIKDSSVDAQNSVAPNVDLKSDDKQTDENSARDVDNNFQSADEMPVVDSDFGENEKRECVDVPCLVPTLICRDFSRRAKSQTQDERWMHGVWRRSYESRQSNQRVDKASIGIKRRSSLSILCSPKKLSKEMSRFPESFQDINTWENPVHDQIWCPSNVRPPSSYAKCPENSSATCCHGNEMQMSPPEMHSLGISPPGPNPWHNTPVPPPDMSVPPPSLPFPPSMATPPFGRVPWSSNFPPFVGVPPPVPPGFVPPGSYMAPTNVFQPPFFLPPVGVPPPPLAMTQYPPYNGMFPGYPDGVHPNVSSGIPPPDQTYQEWCDWSKNFSKSIQNCLSNSRTEQPSSSNSEALVSTNISKSSGNESSLDVTKATVVKAPVVGETRPISPTSLIPLPSTTHSQVVTLTMALTNPSTSGMGTMVTKSSNLQGDVTMETHSFDMASSPPPLPYDDVSKQNLNVSEKKSDLLIKRRAGKIESSSNFQTAELGKSGSLRQNLDLDVERTASYSNRLVPVHDSQPYKPKQPLELKPPKPSSHNRLQNLTSLAASFRTDASLAAESNDSISSSSSSSLTNMLSIGNLPMGTKALEIRKLISKYGKVLNCKVGALKSQKEAGLFALVTMETEKDVQSCIAKLNKTNYDGRQISVQKFEPAA